MNGHGYMNIVSSSHMKPVLLSQEFNFRWPHNGTNNERDSLIHLPEKNFSPRIDGKYTTIRNPCDVRSRYDTSSVVHDEQQRLQALYMDQFHKGENNDAQTRVCPSGNEFRFPVYDGRQSVSKKCGEENYTYDNLKTAYEYPHYVTDSKVLFTGIEGGYTQNGYLNASTTNGKSSVNEPKRYASENADENEQNQKCPLSTVSAPQNTLQKLNEPINSSINIFSENINNLTLIKEESVSKRANIICGDGVPKIRRNVKEPLDYSTLDDLYSTEKEKNITADKANVVEYRKPVTSVEKGKKSVEDKVSISETITDNGLPSYTAMIAQAIIKKSSKSTLSDIYDYMEKTFPSLEKRGTGWRNCVRHTLSLNDCFLKLHRPENGRSCNWTIHPSYYESFSRGDYRKKRALRKRTRGVQWMDPLNFNGYPVMREHEIPDVNSQQQPFFHFSTPPSIWNVQGGYNCSFVQNSSDHLHHFPPHPPPPSHPPTSPSGNIDTPSYGGQVIHHGHFANSNCTYPDCYCQYSRNSCRVYSI